MSQTATPAELLSIKDFARRSSLSESTVRRRIAEGSIPFRQFGGKGKRLLIPVSALSSVAPSAAPTSLQEPRDVARPRRGRQAKWKNQQQS